MSTRAPSRRPGLWAVFAVPIAIALLSVVGLVAALTGDGLRDVVSWLGLAAPVAVTGWAMRRRPR
jgi:uncharacterized membrane protein